MKNLHQIRCYGKYYEPSAFKKKGWRGWWIRVLNRCRFWLECKVTYHVLRLSAQAIGETIVDVKSVIKEFESDLQTEREHFIQPRPRMTISTTGSVEGHLRELEKKPLLNPREHTAQVLARYGSDPRSRRYAFSRNHKIMMEAELPQPQEIKTHGETVTPFQPPRRSESERRTTQKVTINPLPFAGSSTTGRVRPIHPEYAEEPLEDFSGFVGDDKSSDDSLRAERLRSTSSDDATAIEEYQRFILSGSATAAHRSDESSGGSDGAGEERPSRTTEHAEEYRGEENSSRTAEGKAESGTATLGSEE